LSLIFEMINVQTDPSTTDTKETILETVAQSSSSEPENLDTSSESSHSIDLMPWLILFTVAFFVFGSINALMKQKKHGSGGNARGFGSNVAGFGGNDIGGDCGDDGGC